MLSLSNVWKKPKEEKIEMSGVLEKTLSGLVHSVFGASSSSGSGSITKHGAVGLLGLKNVSLGLIHFVEKLQAAQRISKQVR